MQYGYEYFCGANVVVEIENFPVLEAAGVTYSIQESKAPIYGYSSRWFDAVARGQVIVRGSIVVNYVHQDYLYHAIRLGLTEGGYLPDPPAKSDELQAQLSLQSQRDSIVSELMNNYPDNIKLAEALKAKYWDSDVATSQIISNELALNPNPHDSLGGLDIKITFGDRSLGNDFSGFTGLLLSNVYFVGRGMPIRIDEEVLVEEYSFFGRNVMGLRPAYVTQERSTYEADDDPTRNAAGGTEISVSPIPRPDNIDVS